jgi:tyrosyl-tRNA synthetase
MTQHAANPGARLAQHLLASEVLELVHGPVEAAKTRQEHQAMRKLSMASLLQQSQTTSSNAYEASPSRPAAEKRIALPRSLATGSSFAKLLHSAGLAGTKSEAARLIKSGGVYVAASEDASKDGEDSGALSFVPITDQKPEEIASFVEQSVFVIRMGKWKVRVIEIVD